MNQDNGNILMKLIYLCMDHLMHNPKRAIIILFAVFIVTMITGELIGTMRNSEIVFSPTAIPIVSGRSEDYFNLPEINDHGAVDLTPHPEITETSTPVMPIVKTQTPMPTEAQPVSCTSDLNIAAGKMAVIDFPGGYSAEIKVRYRPEDPNIITGSLRSGDKQGTEILERHIGGHRRADRNHEKLRNGLFPDSHTDCVWKNRGFFHFAGNK